MLNTMYQLSIIIYLKIFYFSVLKFNFKSIPQFVLQTLAKYNHLSLNISLFLDKWSRGIKDKFTEYNHNWVGIIFNTSGSNRCRLDRYFGI